MYEDIIRVIDKYFAFLEELDGFHDIAELVPNDMIDNTRPLKFEGTRLWKVIPSKVTNKQIQEYENRLGSRLPKSYKFFLKYKNFIEMSLGEYQIVFFKNLSTDWMETLLEECQHYNLGGRGLIPFAHYSDYGVVCFDTNVITNEDFEPPIVWLDHQNGFDQADYVASSFVNLIASCDPHLDDWIKNSRDSRR